MESSVSPKDETWFLRVCHHISNAVYVTFEISNLTLIFKTKTIEKVVLSKWNCVWQMTFILSVKYCLHCTLTFRNMAMVRKPSCSLLYLTQSESVPVDVTHKNGLLFNVIKLCVNFPITPTRAHDVRHTGLLPPGPEFNSRPLSLGSMVRTVAPGDVVVRVISCQYHFANIPYTYFLNCYRRYIISAIDNVVMTSRAHTRSKACFVFYHSSPEIEDPVLLAAWV
jgi:hypothetical protein